MIFGKLTKIKTLFGDRNRHSGDKDMKRKLVGFDVIRNIENKSVSFAEKEITEALNLLAQALQKDSVSIHCLDESTVTLLASDGNYVNGKYEIDEKGLKINSLQEFVLDESALNQESLKTVSLMLESILDDKTDEANAAFDKYITTPNVRRAFLETALNEGKVLKKKKKDKKKSGKRFKVAEKMASLVGKSLKGLKGKMKPKCEAFDRLASNVLEVLDIEAGSPNALTLNVVRDEDGQINEVQIPKGKTSNVLHMGLPEQASVVHERASALKMLENKNFVRAISDLKRAVAIQDKDRVDTVLENIIGAFPDLAYLTQKELASMAHEALVMAEATNWDDKTCDVLSESILKTAHQAYAEKVARVYKIAGVKPQNDYDNYQELASSVFEHLDDINNSQRKMYNDLYESLAEIHKVVDYLNDVSTKFKIESYMSECANVVENKTPANNVISEEIAVLLKIIAEANIPGAGEWHVSDTPHISLTGENPATAQNAKVDAVPSKYNGDFSETEAEASEGNGANKKVASDLKNAYTAHGKDLYPNLSNPYTPKAGKFGHDVENSWTKKSSEDVYPTLRNPYIPKTLPVHVVK